MRRIVLVVLVSVAAAVLARPAEAQGGMATWRATELWRVDGTESGDPFGNLRDYVIGKDGALWALDFKDQVIRRFNGNG